MKTSFPNIDFQFGKGNLEALKNTAVVNGSINFTKDSRELFVDIDNRRIKISDIVIDTEVSITSLEKPEKKLYLAIDSFRLLWYDSDLMSWKIVGSDDVFHSLNSDYAIYDSSGNMINQYYISIEKSQLADQELQNQINHLLYIIGDIERFDVELIDDVSLLPPVGTKGVLYFVLEDADAMTKVEEGDKTAKIYGEYIWIEQTITNPPEEGGQPTISIVGYYEKIGITTVDLGNYYTKQEIDTIVNRSETTLKKYTDDSITEAFSVVDFGDDDEGVDE